MIGFLIGLVVGFLFGRVWCSFIETTPCPDCNEGEKKNAL